MVNQSKTTRAKARQKVNKNAKVKEFEAMLNTIDEREHRLFFSLDRENKGYIYKNDLEDVFNNVGLKRNDPRLEECFRLLDQFEKKTGLQQVLKKLSHQIKDEHVKESIHVLEEYNNRTKISYEAFCQIIRPNILLIEKALLGNLIIPDFKEFCEEIDVIYNKTKANTSGAVASYIPQLASVNPEQYAIAVCSIDGQQYAIGDYQVDFCVQSCCKPINYCLALKEHGADYVHQYIGREPSGQKFNELALNPEGKPHNPMINAGAIISTSMIQPQMDIADRFDYLIQQWTALAGGEKARFNNAVYLSERDTADRNFALAYFMRENKAFPKGADLLETLELYFQCCSIEVNAQMMSGIASTLANGGISPITGERILTPKIVQNCLSLMYSCGMYDFSGEFAFSIGLPAKSGVGGAIMIVIPNVMGICVWSPRLDHIGNSVRGIDFCKELVSTFNLHNYDNLTGLTEKKDPRRNQIQAKVQSFQALIWAASKGDLGAIHRLVLEGVDINRADYDGRTPLHLAAAEGQLEVANYLMQHGVDINPRDRWGGTPLDDAYLNQHQAVLKLLEENGAKRSFSKQQIQKFRKEMAEHLQHQSSEPDHLIELIWAVSEGNLFAVQRLVAQGINFNASDYDGRTPLHLAVSEGHLDIVEYLIKHGANVSPLDRWGHSPLDDARENKRAEIIRYLEQQASK